jgi:hypothetical protein
MSDEEVSTKKRPIDSQSEEDDESNDEWVGPMPTANDEDSASVEDQSADFGVDLNLREPVAETIAEDKPEVPQVKKRKSNY